MNNFDPVTGEPLTPEAKAARAAQEAAKAPQPAAPQPFVQQPVRNEEDLLQVSPNPAPKKKPKALLIGGIAGGVIVLAAIVLLVASLFKSPVSKLVDGAENTVKALAATPLGSTVKDVMDSGSITLSVDLSKNSDLVAAITGQPMKLDAQGEVSMFFKSGAAALSLDATLKDKPLLDALITFSKDDLAVSSTALFSKTNYGINLKNFAKNLKGSIFDPDEETPYAIPEELFEALTGEGGLSISELEKLAKDGQALLQKIEDQLVKSVNKNGKITKGSEKITIADKEISTSTVAIELDGKALKGIAVDMVDFLRKDKDVRAFLTKIQKLAEEGSLGEMMDIDEDFVDEFYDAMDELKDQAEDLEDMMEDMTITLTGYLKGSNLVQAEMDLKENKNKANMRLTIGPDPKNPDEITFTVKDFEGSKITAVYKVSANDKNSYEASFSIKEDSDTPLKGKISWDKKEGGLRITATVNSYDWYYGSSTDEIEFRANMKQSGKKVVLELEKITVNEVSQSLKGITITADGGAKFPSISKYTDILTLSEDDFEELIEDLQKSIQELGESAMKDLQ